MLLIISRLFFFLMLYVCRWSFGEAFFFSSPCPIVTDIYHHPCHSRILLPFTVLDYYFISRQLRFRFARLLNRSVGGCRPSSIRVCLTNRSGHWFLKVVGLSEYLQTFSRNFFRAGVSNYGICLSCVFNCTWHNAAKNYI